MENDINSILTSKNSNNEGIQKIKFNSPHISEASTINSDTQNSKNSEGKSPNTPSLLANLKQKRFHINLKTPKVNLSKLNAENGKKVEDQNTLKDKFNKVNESQISYDTASIKIETSKNYPKEKKKFKLSLYTLEKICNLGSGASGDVFLVQDSQTHKKLALKTVKYSNEEKVEQQLETEVKLSSMLKHENIIKCYATYFLDGTINFVMEYMDKGTLADLIKKVKKIPEDIVGIITYQVVKGLAYIQKDKRIIHRDLKPSNILINSKGYAKISDFGVSAMVEGSWAQKKSMVGTYIYMAPERIDADIYYLNCDVWSLGIIVMECVLGYYPYLIYNNFEPLNSVWNLHELIENNPVPPLDDKIYSKELIDFSKKCLIKNLKERPTATALLQHPFIVKYQDKSREELAIWLNSIK